MTDKSSGPRWLTVLVIVGMALPLIPLPADAQIGQRLRDRARQQIEQRAEQRADEAVAVALDAADSVVCAIDDEVCLRDARAAGNEVVLTREDGTPVARDEYPADALRPGEGVWTNYDFVPGERVLWAENFTRDNVGDFPRRLEFERGNMEVAEWQGRRWLRASTDAGFAIDLAEPLPERFTLELDFRGVGRTGHAVHFADGRDLDRVRFHPSNGGIEGNVRARGAASGAALDAVRTLRVMADGRYVKVYIDESRVANVPNADLGRSDKIVVALTAMRNREVLLGDIRVAAGGRTLYDALSADGRVATQGILFDTGSDRIRPESTPTLQEIGRMLQQHANLRLRIEGHTDSVGSAEMNQQLSERRAQSVRRYLVERFSVDESRLEATGLGQTEPADSNDTPEGRQNNRRVELVRL
jgi:OmpA-OmpF porin, OOP family